MAVSTLLFTIGTNGYGDLFADHIESQRTYAAAHGYDYVAFTRTPPYGITPANSAWLKVPLLRHMLRAGYECAVFADIDALFKPGAPPLERMFVDGKSIYMAPEVDGRFNAGVIVCRNTHAARSFLGWLHTLADVPNFLVPRKDRNLYENGHVNYLSRWFREHIEAISPRWNYHSNSWLPGGDAECYVSHGRSTYKRKPRTQVPPTPTALRHWERLKQGPRTLLLRHVSRWYMDECFPHIAVAYPRRRPSSPR